MSTTLCGFNDSPGVPGKTLLVANGPFLIVRIGFDPQYDVAQPNKLPNIPTTDINALIDTGATDCCIDSALALALQLPIIDQRVCAGISGAKIVNMHIAQIFVPSLQFTFVGAFAGVDLAAGGQMHGALIGRTFLEHFRMFYDGPSGTVSLDGPHF
jgi:hypothetical protein